jgi:hypothetical protein
MMGCLNLRLHGSRGGRSRWYDLCPTEVLSISREVNGMTDTILVMVKVTRW